MKGLHLLCSLGAIGMVWLAGCGRPSLPGGQLTGPQVATSVAPERGSPLPQQPSVEWGDPSAKVHVLAFYVMDDRHKPLMDLFKGLASQHRGKVYVKYTDYRTPGGQVAMQEAKASTDSLLINGRSEFEVQARPHPYTVTFVQEMGRYWTADDLKAAVAQAVAEAYSGGGKNR